MTAKEHEISDDEYEDMLNEIYGEVTVCGYTHDQGSLLKEINPIAFQCGKSDEMRWECSECGKVYDEEDDAEECCPEEDDKEMHICLQCGEDYDLDDPKEYDADEEYCSGKCRKEAEDNLDSHLGDKK